MNTVNGNVATLAQFQVILGLTPAEAETMLEKRPFATLFDFRRALPFRVARNVHALDFPKLDLNSAPAEDFVKAGLPPEVAAKVVAGAPYYSLNEVRTLSGMTADAFAALDLAFAPRALTYSAKLSGQSVQLTADPSEVVVTLKQVEDVGGPKLAQKGFSELFAGRRSDQFRVFSAPQTEGEEDALAAARRDPSVDRVIPAFRDSNGRRRYLDPRLCNVQFKSDTSVDRQNAIVAEVGLTVARRFRANGLLTLQTPNPTDHPGVILAAIARLNAFPEVKVAEPNFVGFDDIEVVVPVRQSAALDIESVGGLDWNLQLAHIPDAWASGVGSPAVTIVVVDSGVDATHPALADGLLPREADDNWNFADSTSPEPKDDLGHGTFIAGILVGGKDHGVNGICPGCRVMSLKVQLEGEQSAYATRADAILYALDRVPADHRIVFNLSWKTTGDIDVIHSAIQEAVSRRGAIVVTSAGNEPDGPDEPHYPSDYPETMSVAALDPDKRRASYSYFGVKVDLSAPGGDASDNPSRNIRSCAIGGGTQVGAGTSYAAPHVVGAAALILSQFPAVSVADLRGAIESTASALVDSGMGRGLVNAGAALPAASGGAAQSGGDDALTLINTGNVDALVQRFGLLAITARVIVAKRPVASLQQIRGALGLTDAQFAALSAPLAAAA